MAVKLLTYQEFRRTHPAVRCFFKFSPEQRANNRASHRLTHGQREAMGEKYYAHPLVPDLAFPTAKAATVRAYAVYLGPEPTQEPDP